jgi:hypothetical protein
MQPSQAQYVLFELKDLLMTSVKCEPYQQPSTSPRDGSLACRYTAELVSMLDPAWTVVLGLLDGDTHTWNERLTDGAFGDLTDDQFGRPRVQLLPALPPEYVAHRWTDSGPTPYRTRATY